MGHVPSTAFLRGETRIAAGAKTHFEPGAGCSRLSSMVLGTTVDAGCGGAFYPLSPMQQGMLFHRVNGGGSGVDVEQVICELRHEVSAPEFIEACQTIVRRHDTFRTRFVAPEGTEPRQVVDPAERVVLPVRVLNFAREDDIERILEEYLASDRRAGFASLAAPLARVALFQGGGSRAWFVFTYHHLVLDARGMCVLFEELLDVHDALVAGRIPELPAIHPYGEYIAWLQTLDTRRAEEFWREQLRGFATPTLLPLPQPAEALAPGDDAPGELVMRLSPSETARLRETAKRCDVTLNTVVQAAWAIVLSRYTGENDVIFGAVRACRHVPVEGAANMAGMLINTVPLRVRLAGAASLSHWLRGLREQWVALRDYEHTSLARTQQWSDAPAGRPLFDTLLNFQEPSWSEALRRLGGIWEKRVFEKRSQPNYPLALDVHGDDALLVRAFYDRRRFTADGLARLLQHFRTALLALAEPRLDTLAEVSLLDDAERARVLGQFNATTADYPREICAHVLFETQAAATPHRIAVADAVTTLTYGELNRRANRLARHLRNAGVRPDVAVAVGMRRSVAMLVAWLGVLKAGGAFVPLDPDYPADRLAYQISDCGAPVVITRSDTEGLFPSLPAGTQHVIMAADGNGFEAEAESDLNVEISSDRLAYIIYTSGSTGQPKGVEIEHRALLNLVTWHQRTYGLTPLDRAMQVASPAFDASVWEVWPYLTCGASVHVPDEETRISPPRLWRWMATERITVAFLPTPLAEAAIAEPVPASLALRVLLTGGDQLKRGVPRDFPCELVNHYGPTESTVVATAAVVARNAVGAPPIGRPIANTRAYVLDRDFHPAPIGVPGELFIGGESLARGYRNRTGPARPPRAPRDAAAKPPRSRPIRSGIPGSSPDDRAGP